MHSLHPSTRWRYRFIGAIAALAVWSANAEPLTFLVGGDTCDFNNIQSAINAAASNPGPDTIRMAMNASYTTQALSISMQDLDMIGGFPNFASRALTPIATTTINGAACGHPHPVRSGI